MTSPKAACEPEQEEMDNHRISRAQQQTPPTTSRSKRQRSPSPLEGDSKRRALSADHARAVKSPILEFPTNKPPAPKPGKPVSSEENHYCPNCGHPCWLCKSSTAVPPEQPGLGDEDEFERSEMAPDDVPSTTDTSSNVPSSKKRKKDHYAQLGINFIGPRDKGFKDHILDPLGVKWANSPHLTRKPSLALRSQPLPHSRTIIKSDDQDMKVIAADFREWKTRSYDEHSLSTLCWDSIVLRDRLVENALLYSEPYENEEELMVEDQKPIVISVRRDKWKPEKQGPSMSQGTYVYDWELEPDTSYAVSIRMFNLEYRNELHVDALLPWVAEKDVAVCPYLTIEYKCSSKGGNLAHATNQATAAAVLWLHQRKGLRNTIGRSFDGLSHFTIVIIDSTYVISEARPKGNEYMIQEQVTGDLTRIDDLRLYIEWSNAIHAWGLGANASTFKKDIELLVALRSAQTPSSLPTPAGTASPMGPPVQRLDQSLEKGKEDADAAKVTS